jgi:hypothetical protein
MTFALMQETPNGTVDLLGSESTDQVVPVGASHQIRQKLTQDRMGKDPQGLPLHQGEDLPSKPQRHSAEIHHSLHNIQVEHGLSNQALSILSLQRTQKRADPKPPSQSSAH